MASAFQDKHGWIADFRPLFEKKHRRVRVPASEADPLAYAKACERYCRLLETAWPAEADIATALELRAITEAQALALRGGLPVEPCVPSPRLTLVDAACQHPSTMREEKNAPADYDRHVAALKDFVAWSGVATLEALRLSHVQRYIAHMQNSGLKYPSRRHRLCYIRRASRMGAALGLPDPLAGFVLDRDDSPAPVLVWAPGELMAAAAGFQATGQPRALAALALGGLAGLRPSEMIRAKARDFDGQTIVIGREKAKNRQSRRELPLPKLAREWLKAWCEGKDPDCPILAPEKRISLDAHAEYDHRALGQWLAPALAAASGKTLPIKCLRKSFATWAIVAGADPRLVDEYLGHVSGSVSAITARHYMASVRINDLRKVAQVIDKSVKCLLDSEERLRPK